MEIERHVQAIQEHGAALADAAERAGLDAKVPTCPEWRVRDLVGHQGQVHRWAATYVASAHTDTGVELESIPADDELLAWFRAGHARLVAAIKAAPADLECWSFLPAPTPLAFWARRQAHETTIHRADAESATGKQLDVDAALAVDGIDELLLGFYNRKRGRLVTDPALTLGIRVTDAQPDDAWTMVIRPDGRDVTRGSASGDCVVSGSASDVYQLLWNRRDRGVVDVEGDATILDLWQQKAPISWG